MHIVVNMKRVSYSNERSYSTTSNEPTSDTNKKTKK